MVTISSFKFALKGLKAVFSRERNAKIHLFFALTAVVASLVFKISSTKFLLVTLAIILVFFAEIVNTALEKTLDTIYVENSQVVRLVKDMAAAGVLVTATGSIIVAIVVFGPPLIEFASRIIK